MRSASSTLSNGIVWLTITAYFFPVGDEVFGDFEDLVGVAHRSDDGDLVAHQIDEFDRHGILVHRDDTKPGTPFGGGQRGIDHCGRACGVEIDISACPAWKQGFALAVQFDEPLRDVLVGGVDHRVGANRQGLLQPRRNQIGDDDVFDTNGFERDGGAKPDGPGAEHQDLVGGFGLALVHAVPRHGHRLVERGHLERDVVGHHLETLASHRVFDEQVLRQCTAGSAVTDDPAGCHHRIHDDVIAYRDSCDLAADLDNLARGLVAEWRLSRT